MLTEMRTLFAGVSFILLFLAPGVNAQQQRFMIRVTDTGDQTVLLENATSSSYS